jgi:hypothetical protein
VTKLGLWYLFGLKGNQPHLYGFARECQDYSIGKGLFLSPVAAELAADDEAATVVGPQGCARQPRMDSVPVQRLLDQESAASAVGSRDTSRSNEGR